MARAFAIRRAAVFQVAAVIIASALAISWARGARETAVHKQNYETYTRVVKLMDEQQKHAEAQSLLEGLVRQYPNSYLLAFRYGYSLSAAGKHREALQQYERALALDPYIILDGYYLVLTGDSLYQLGEYAKAKVYLEAAIKNPKLPENLNQYARRLLDTTARKGAP